MNEELSKCTSLEAVADRIRRTKEDEKARASAAAYGMALTVAALCRKPTFYAEALEVLDQLALAKATLDIAACHGYAVSHVTAHILQAAQDFLDRETIPCTEWPSTEEIAEFVVHQASQ